ncbi:MAG TPA: lactate utilization protein [Verrucomicrobiota bacterium]|nr:lactate utilization protein [Verrucomicrobiota bacterium]HQB17063.1 lactate utilization protein [Verrucomicrobiota bacterium]
MSERDNIFVRIKEALTLQAPARHGHGLPTIEEQRRVMPPVGQTEAELFELFAKNVTDLRATFKRVKDLSEVAAELRALRDAEKWQRVATHRGAIAESQARELALPLMVVEENSEKHELEQCDVGITECDALVAQTGTVLVTSRTAGGRALTCLPPHHVVLARREQMVPDLPAAMQLVQQKFGDKYPSMISFITGASRTGDIERILVLGAHGPKQLTIICCDA